MRSYDLSSEFGNDPEYLGVSSYWLLAIVRYQHPLTPSKTRIMEVKDGDSGTGVSFNSSKTIISETREIMLIGNDCVSLSVNYSKSSHVPSLTAVLVNSGIDYLSEIMPGDWVFAWIVNSEESYVSLVQRATRLEPCNKFDDGLKFVGKIRDVGKTLRQDQNGLKTVQYNLQAAAFTELDNKVFFDPHLAEQYPSIGTYMAKMGISINAIFEKAAKEAKKGTGGIVPDKAIPELLNTMIGKGIDSKTVNNGSNLSIVSGPSSDSEVPYAYLIPDKIAKLLGIQDKSKGMFSYADILTTIIGLQKYTRAFTYSHYDQDNNLVSQKDKDDQRKAHIFKPDLSQDSGNRLVSEYQLKGRFLPFASSFSGKSAWSLVEEFLNPAINEMYTAFRADPTGAVMPTLVVRQLPFSSRTIANKYNKEVTAMDELPRWRADELLVKTMDIGHTDSTHFNFIHVYGTPSQSSPISVTDQIVLNPPFRDDQDIKRHGLRMYSSMVNCSTFDLITDGPRIWMFLLSDMYMGMQFTLNGACLLQGISAPICPGDNFEFDDTLYHIESVTHECGMRNGTKFFLTRLSLSHGIKASPHTVPEDKQRTVAVRDNIVEANFAKTARRKKPGWGIKKQEVKKDMRKDTILINGNEINPDLFIYSNISDNITTSVYDNASNNPGTSIDKVKYPVVVENAEDK